MAKLSFWLSSPPPPCSPCGRRTGGFQLPSQTLALPTLQPLHVFSLPPRKLPPSPSLIWLPGSSSSKSEFTCPFFTIIFPDFLLWVFSHSDPCFFPSWHSSQLTKKFIFISLYLYFAFPTRRKGPWGQKFFCLSPWHISSTQNILRINRYSVNISQSIIIRICSLPTEESRWFPTLSWVLLCLKKKKKNRPPKNKQKQTSSFCYSKR